MARRTEIDSQPAKDFPSAELSEYRFVIDWLMSVGGVASTRLGELFSTSPENIRRIKYFASRQFEPSLITFVPDLEMIPATAMHRGVGIRCHREILRRSEKPSRTTDWLEYQIDSQFESHRQQYRFLTGARSLLRLKQKLGHISEARRMALAGRLEQKIAWLLVHSGLVRSAIDHANLSLWLLQSSYYRLRRAETVREFIKTSLIASQGNLLAGRPAAALQVLDVMRDACRHIGAEPGSDFHRQRGVAFFQLGSRHDGEATDCFAESQRQMRKLGEGGEAAALMTDKRYASLLRKPEPEWEGSLEVHEAAAGTFSADSLEVAMTRHWAVACGLLTGDGRIRQSALDLLEANREPVDRFGHQATVFKLLSMTPELGLPRGLEAIWIRKALYQNIFRFK
jgi:hypothetical protein